MKKNNGKFKKAIKWGLPLLILVFVFKSCWSMPITLTVLDAETKKPIEGAVAIAWWHNIKGSPGLTHTVTEKVLEAVSGPDGKIKLKGGQTGFFWNRPGLKVYKPGYVGWDFKQIYKGHHGDNIISVKTERRNKKFRWEDQVIYLEKFKEGYSYISHGMFLSYDMGSADTATEAGSKYLYWEATRWEDSFSNLEQDKLDQKRLKELKNRKKQ